MDVNRIYYAAQILPNLVVSLTCLLMNIGLLLFVYGWIPLASALPVFLLYAYMPYLFSSIFARIDRTLMGFSDSRMALVKEAIYGIRQIKLASLESQWKSRIVALREKEVGAIKRSFHVGAYYTFITTGLPYLLNVVSNGTYYWMYGTLPPSIAFGKSAKSSVYVDL